MRERSNSAQAQDSAVVAPAKPSPSEFTEAATQLDSNDQPAWVQEFRRALTPDDPLRSAVKLMPLIDALTLEDFRWLESHPSDFPILREKEFDRKFREQFLNALLERWAALDPDRVFAAASKIESKMKAMKLIASSDLVDALVRSRPDLVLESSTADANRRSQALRELAKRDLAAARRYRDRCSNDAERKSADVAIARGLASSDPLAAAALARELNAPEVFLDAVNAAARLGGDVLQQVLEGSKKELGDKLDLPSLILRYPNISWESLPVEISQKKEHIGLGIFDDARRLKPAEREALIARLDQLPPGTRDNVASAVAATWANQEPQAALDWAFSRASGEDVASPESQPLSWAFWEWLRADKDAAMAWASQLPASPLRDSLSCHAATHLARIGETDAALQLFKPVTGPANAGLVQNLVSAEAKRDPVAAAAWLDSLPADVEVGKAPKTIVSRWFSRDPTAAAKWVESLPAGRRREYALQAYARAAADTDPALAGEWAAAVSDPVQRARAAEAVYRELSDKDPATAREWLKQLPGLDENWRNTILRRQSW